LGVLPNAVGFVINFGEMYEHNLYVDHYFEVLELPRKIKEVKRPRVFKKFSPPKIEFKNVSFHYPKGPMVLKDLSFVINPRQGSQPSSSSFVASMILAKEKF
jgi:ABC-type multidrug transport system fused ATPase/permease subunit